ncbi:hypothetical protein EM858_24865 [Agrobacterium sp. CNPSo 2736]|nr:hypothetical protein EM858_24865 [Agrobacterium sp. CNPSo 2736]
MQMLFSGIKPHSKQLKTTCINTVASRRASARREESFPPKDLGWLDPCDRHRDEGGCLAITPVGIPVPFHGSARGRRPSSRAP